MIKIIRATQETRERDKKRKRFILKLDIAGYYDEQHQSFHLTEQEVERMKSVLNGRRLK